MKLNVVKISGIHWITFCDIVIFSQHRESYFTLDDFYNTWRTEMLYCKPPNVVVENIT